jgi:hypothetical protein
MHLGKYSIHNLRVLFDSGSSGSIIVAKVVKNLQIENDTKTEWLTKGGTFGKCMISEMNLTNSKLLNGSYFSIRLSVLINIV